MLLKKKTENEIRECRLAQIDYCDKKGRPYFAPRDGVCFRCKRDIYQNVGWKNSSSYSKTRIEKDGEKVDSITGISLVTAGRSPSTVKMRQLTNSGILSALIVSQMVRHVIAAEKLRL